MENEKEIRQVLEKAMKTAFALGVLAATATILWAGFVIWIIRY